MKKNLLVAVTAATLALGVAAPVAAYAQSDNSTGSSIANKIATKFNLNKDEVQKVIDEERAVRHAEHEQEAKEKLTELVKSGTLTQAQADKITAKRAEMKADMEKNRDAMKDKTEAERKATMEAKKTELDNWAKDNGIDASYLRPDHGGKGPGGHGHGMR